GKSNVGTELASGSSRSLLYLKTPEGKKLRKTNVEQIWKKQSKPTNNYTEQSFSERIQPWFGCVS
ncbi:hypothetical protein LEMLEM_LOCUS25485, partial [Lemmus lemmus]